MLTDSLLHNSVASRQGTSGYRSLLTQTCSIVLVVGQIEVGLCSSLQMKPYRICVRRGLRLIPRKVLCLTLLLCVWVWLLFKFAQMNHTRGRKQTWRCTEIRWQTDKVFKYWETTDMSQFLVLLWNLTNRYMKDGSCILIASWHTVYWSKRLKIEPPFLVFQLRIVFPKIHSPNDNIEY